MKLLILEDEQTAARHLRRLVEQLAPDAQITAVLDSVSAAVAWLQANPPPDLMLMDIQLADGLSFDIAESVTVTCPVIFTTAYDQFALRAFELNSVDYLLKPIHAQSLKQAFDRFQQRKTATISPTLLNELRKTLNQQDVTYKERFLSKLGNRLIAVSVDQIAYFRRDGVVTAVTHDNRSLPLDLSLDGLLACLDPAKFFRLNRQFIASLKAIADIRQQGRARLKVTLEPVPGKPVFVSEENAARFKAWLDASG